MYSSLRIAHLDMDAFFASVELLRYPELRGQAVVVGGRGANQPDEQTDGSKRFARLREYVGRGVVTTSTYEARRLDVFSGMGLMKAAKLAPDAILLPANFDDYRHYSRCFKAAVARIAPLIEDRGIDEIYIDLSSLPEESLVLAQRIKSAVLNATGLTCSIAISPNKLLSKIGSDLDKPDGLTLLNSEDIPTRIWPLPAKKINGIGPRATEKLTRLGINTIGELAATPIDFLLAHFGRSTGNWMHRAANGIDERPIITESVPKSISRETTFERDLDAKRNRSELSGIFAALCVRVADDLRQKGYASRTIGVKLRYSDFHVTTRDITLAAGIDTAGDIQKAARECLKRADFSQKIRLLGVRASGLVSNSDVNSNTNEAVVGLQSCLPFDRSPD